MGAIGKKKAPLPLEEYQAAERFLTVAGRTKSALHEVPTIASGTPDTKRGIPRVVQVDSACAPEFESDSRDQPRNSVMARPAQAMQYGDDACARVSNRRMLPHDDSGIDYIIHDDYEFAFDCGAAAFGRRYSTGNNPVAGLSAKLRRIRIRTSSNETQIRDTCTFNKRTPHNSTHASCVSSAQSHGKRQYLGSVSGKASPVGTTNLRGDPDSRRKMPMRRSLKRAGVLSLNFVTRTSWNL